MKLYHVIYNEQKTRFYTIISSTWRLARFFMSDDDEYSEDSSEEGSTCTEFILLISACAELLFCLINSVVVSTFCVSLIFYTHRYGFGLVSIISSAITAKGMAVIWQYYKDNMRGNTLNMQHYTSSTVSNRSTCLMVLCLGFFMITLCNASTSEYQTLTPRRTWPTIISSKHHQQYQISTNQQSIECPTSCECRLFLWDILSYLKYKHTTYQVKEQTIEGLGGKKFIRIQPNTLLERWYPQLRKGLLKPDSCALCGYSWDDHLMYWDYLKQKKRGISEFDQYINTELNLKGKSYTRYVQEVENNKYKHRSRVGGKEVRQSYDGSVTFLVEPYPSPKDGIKMSIQSALLLAMARIQALLKVEDLIWLNRIDELKSKED